MPLPLDRSEAGPRAIRRSAVQPIREPFLKVIKLTQSFDWTEWRGAVSLGTGVIRNGPCGGESKNRARRGEVAEVGTRHALSRGWSGLWSLGGSCSGVQAVPSS